ncbi:hypothetical protein H6G20_03780 [Desertifilum sp. FACHB-1129]|uniref:Uncharacterized protein n=2 Tax=Desertifilum tharense IPPAS B-1220 TaxID=1781255 RepID=A0A1E5QKP7_9CYAN|nr:MULTISPECIES: hypothetical protein [Desertifilum]MBD2310800.1 hypothetical protein [Desertifilum sp. FACHB-1129]MBD2320837.1 hypothetical protein [Desertifilum sp. FACHB-866]MDA0209709.1 hypothetical protein [Cyanobacteria bacterium FC1]MBD2330965.1 hypothetical protein [Desertifilum sp. FACHB-868]OEJ75210.1 hypothetical protein BH720_10845 [Desertifilum tharense IPPAS B-1220]
MIDNIQKDMTDLLNYIYDNEGDCYGIDYFSQFLNDLKKYDFAEILAYQAKFSVNYGLSFILSTPSLWMNMSELDWVQVMSALNPRPNPFRREVEDAGYIELHFLCKYLRVNAIEMFLQQKQFSNEDKKKFLQYAKKISDILFMEDLDLEDLDGNYFVHKDILEKTRLILLSTQKVSDLKYNRDELQKYLEEQLKFFNT